MRKTANFTEREWNCKCSACNQQVPHKMQENVMRNVQLLRDFMRKGLILTSAYRCELHKSEAKKAQVGQHGLGTAVDIRVSNGYDAARIIQYAIKYLGVQGWAYSKKSGFVHLDWRTTGIMTWEY